MFDTLADRMRHDDHVEVSARERVLRWSLVIVLSFLLFGGLYWGVKVLE